MSIAVCGSACIKAHNFARANLRRLGAEACSRRMVRLGKGLNAPVQARPEVILERRSPTGESIVTIRGSIPGVELVRPIIRKVSRPASVSA